MCYIAFVSFTSVMTSFREGESILREVHIKRSNLDFYLILVNRGEETSISFDLNHLIDLFQRIVNIWIVLNFIFIRSLHDDNGWLPNLVATLLQQFVPLVTEQSLPRIHVISLRAYWDFHSESLHPLHLTKNLLKRLMTTTYHLTELTVSYIGTEMDTLAFRNLF